MEFSIYVITNALNGRRYVGQTMQPARRFYAHSRKARTGTGEYLHTAMRKHGADAFTFKIIETCSTKERADDLERRWIRLCNSLASGHGYNLTEGGGGVVGFRPTPEQIARAASTHIGKKRTPEQRARISASITGRKQSQVHITARVAKNKGKTRTLEQNAATSARLIGIVRGPMSQAHKDKIAEAMRRFRAAQKQRAQ